MGIITFGMNQLSHGNWSVHEMALSDRIRLADRSRNMGMLRMR